MIKNLPAIWETWVQSLGYKEHLEKVLFIPTPVFLPGVPTRTKEPGRLQYIGSQRVRHN